MRDASGLRLGNGYRLKGMWVGGTNAVGDSIEVGQQFYVRATNSLRFLSGVGARNTAVESIWETWLRWSSAGVRF